MTAPVKVVLTSPQAIERRKNLTMEKFPWLIYWKENYFHLQKPFPAGGCHRLGFSRDQPPDKAHRSAMAISPATM